MTADIFAALQAFPNTQTIQLETQQTPSDETATQFGLFASLMNECIAEGEAADLSAQMFAIPENTLAIPENGSEPQIMAFTSNKAFPQSVMNILAGEAENSPDTPSDENMPLTENALPSQEKPVDDSDIVIWPEDETPQNPTHEPSHAEDMPPEIQEPSLSEDMPPEIQEPSHSEDIPPKIHEPSRAEDMPPEIHEPSRAENPTPKIPDSPARFAKASDDTEDSHESEETHEHEETPELPEVSAEFAALAGITTPQPQISAQPEIQDTQTQPERSAVFSQPTRQRRTQPETHAAPREQKNVTENQEVRADIPVNREEFSEHEGNPDAQQQNPNPQSQNHSNTQTQAQSRKTASTNIKTEAASQTPAPESRRTESRSDFGAYFEGVLNSRRSTARTSEPMPLNLRSAENFSQAQAVTLRDGITNVVRFIRADGVQKARVVVDPPALGRISVELTSGTSGVQASIKVASEQIRQLVQDQISQLRMNLSQQGVQVAEFTVDVQQDNSGNHGQQGQENNAGRFGFVDDSDDDDEAELFRIDLNEGLLYWVA